ncbi:hypothetical protein BURK1_00915 [Burkholderiales bacterium]|nr:hypothetical protein BURK1_00915 [Burkholderiales bacterium]
MRNPGLALLLAAACGAAQAQPSAPFPDGPRIPSLPEAAFERIDQALRDRVASADGADAQFVRGLQATMDPGARIAGYADAWRRRPDEILFLASLADACMVRAIPSWPDCAALDPVSRWAARDGGNAVPWVLLAERARQRGDLPGMRAQLAQAAASGRFDSYRERGGPAVWRVLAAAPAVAGEPEAPFASAALGAARADVATTEAATMCRRGAPGVDDEVEASCRALARTMAGRADTYAARLVGLALAWSWAPGDDERRRLSAERDRTEAASLQCGNAKLALIESLNRDAASRETSRRIQAAALDDAATKDEAAVCASLVARAREARLL